MSSKCYDNTKSVECDGCSKTIKGKNEVYHCLNENEKQHEEGYDLCKKCAIPQSTENECICGSKLALIAAKDCYGDSDSIECDECHKTIKGKKKVYHCNNKKTKKHEDGYDLCTKCVLSSNPSNKTKSNTLRANRNELLVSGYIREIQSMLNDKDKIIPMEIHGICYQFYLPSIVTGIYLYDYSASPSKRHQFAVLNMDIKKCTMIQPQKVKKPNAFTWTKAFCHISNMGKFNGILTCIYDTTQHQNNQSHSGPALRYESFPYLLQYKPSYTDNTVDIEQVYKSKKSIPCLPRQWLLCGTNGDNVVYEYNGKLFQHKFANKFCDFVEMKQKKQKFRLKNTTRRAQWLNMTYLAANNCIFSASNWGSGPVKLKKYKKPTLQKYNIQSGLFDIKRKKWIDIQSLQGEIVWNATNFQSVCCYGGSHSMFMATSIRRTVQYDLSKNQWIDILEDPKFYATKHSVLWLENEQTLNIMNQLQSNPIIKTLTWNVVDLRENTKRCMPRTEPIDGIPDFSAKNITVFQ